jgi:hypothetical protein
LAVSVVAIVISLFSVKYTRAQAAEAKKVRLIEAERRHQEREPVLTAEVEPVNDGAWFQLWLTSGSPTVLHRVEARLLDRDVASFTSGQDGVAPMNAQPQDASHDFPEGFLAGDRCCWRIQPGEHADVGTVVRVRVRCHGRDPDAAHVGWTVLVQAEIPPYKGPMVRWL